MLFLFVSPSAHTFQLRMRGTQDEDSTHRIPQDPAGKMRESRCILQENTGNRWNVDAVFRPEIFGFFPVDSCQFPVLSGRNQAESIG